MATGNVHVATQTSGAQTAGWEAVPLHGGLHRLSRVAQVQAGKAEPHSDEAKDSHL